MDDLGRLTVFRDVVDAGGFSRAAARRGLSHSTVSKHVASLEAELGARLLNRTSRVMSLTEPGRLVLEYARQVGDAVSELRERLDALRDEATGELRINSIVHVGQALVQPAISAFLAEYPRTRVTLVLDDGPLRFTRDGFDVAVRVGLHAEGSLAAVKVMDNEVCIVGAPALLERYPEPQHPAELVHLPAIGYRSPDYDISAWTYVESGEIRRADINPVCIVNDGRSLLDLVRAGVGIGYVSRFAAAALIREGALIPLVKDFALPPFDPVYLVQAPSAARSLKQQAFRRHLTAAADRLRAPPFREP